MTSHSTSSSTLLSGLNTPVDPRWYETFFTAPINDFWNSLIPESVTQAEIEFLQRHLKTPVGARILDVPCGSGRHSIALAQRGYNVTGIDLSSDALNKARNGVASPRLQLTFCKQDMCGLEFRSQFDAAICMGNSFGYGSHVDCVQFLQRLHAALKPNASFILDTGMAAESLLTSLERESQYDANGYVFSIRNEYDITQSRLLTRSTLRKDGREWHQNFSQAVYSCGELTRMFEQTGFNILGRYGDTDDAPYKVGDSRLLIVATRR